MNYLDLCNLIRKFNVRCIVKGNISYTIIPNSDCKYPVLMSNVISFDIMHIITIKKYDRSVR